MTCPIHPPARLVPVGLALPFRGDGSPGTLASSGRDRSAEPRGRPLAPRTKVTRPTLSRSRSTYFLGEIGRKHSAYGPRWRGSPMSVQRRTSPSGRSSRRRCHGRLKPWPPRPMPHPSCQGALMRTRGSPDLRRGTARQPRPYDWEGWTSVSRFALPRCCRTDDGQPKLRFTTRADAKEHIRRFPFDPGLHAYKCRHCGYFHVGHQAIEAQRPSDTPRRTG